MLGAASSRMKQHALRNAQPLAAYLELTYACNWRCVFCYNPRHSDIRRMSADQWTEVLEDLRTLGTLTLTLTGGEPLAHPEFFDIARAARERAFSVRIFTNAALIDDATADRIAELLPQGVEVSIHGATAATHDATTGKPGSFQAMWAGIERLRNRGVRVFMKSPLTRLNEHELDALIQLVTGAGLPLHIDPALTPRDDGDMSPLQFLPSPDTVRKLMQKREISHGLKRVYRDEGAVNCGLGTLTLAIDPEGNVYPCIQWRLRPLGNVRDTPLRDLWHSSPERAEAAQVAIDANTRMIESGGPISSFPFCPAIAMQRSGDPFTPDATMLHQAETASEIRDELHQ